MEEIKLTDYEIFKFNVIDSLIKDKISKNRAAILLNVTVRQINRLIIVYKKKVKLVLFMETKIKFLKKD